MMTLKLAFFEYYDYYYYYYESKMKSQKRDSTVHISRWWLLHFWEHLKIGK